MNSSAVDKDDLINARSTASLAFSLAFRELYSSSNIPQVIFDDLENGLRDANSNPDDDYEFSVLASAAAAALLHIRQLHAKSKTPYSGAIINFMNAAHDFVRLTYDYFNIDSEYGRIVAKDANMVTAIMPNWPVVSDTTKKSIAAIKSTRLLLWNAAPNEDEIQMLRDLDSITENIPRDLSQDNLSKLSLRARAFSRKSYPLNNDKKSGYDAIDEQIAIIKLIHDVIESDLPKPYDTQSPDAYYRVQQQKSCRPISPHDMAKVIDGRGRQ